MLRNIPFLFCNTLIPNYKPSLRLPQGIFEPKIVLKTIKYYLCHRGLKSIEHGQSDK